VQPSKHYPHRQTRECEFYEKKGVVTIPCVQQTIFQCGTDYFQCRIEILMLREKGFFNTDLYNVRTAPSKLHNKLECLYKENNAMEWIDDCRRF